LRVIIMSDEVKIMRTKIAELGRMLFDRHLTDTAGGNISSRVGDKICITPRFAGSKFQWQLRPEQVLVCDTDGNLLEGDGEISRESKVHFRLLREFPEGNAVVHAHAQNVLVFSAAGMGIPPVIEDMLKFGEIEVCQFAPAHSEDLANFVTEKMQAKTEALKKQAAIVIAPWHGVFVLGKDLDSAYDAVERVDGAARIILMSSLLPQVANTGGRLSKHFEQLKAAAAKYGKE
jgi:L-fuculose-phosphate aldolase